MSNIKIFKHEIHDGIGDLVKSTASVAYCSPAIIRSGDSVVFDDLVSDEDVKSKVLAQNKDQIDLHYIESVLVSTGWNKNDDVFRPEATWAARNTPEDKPFNYMHDENDIIGHITGSYVLSKDGDSVTGDKMPEHFDIISQAVLYTAWSETENRDRMGQIIAEIQEGKWFVSMECLFAGFDYALTAPDGTNKVLARDDNSSFLTKHLRVYGGTGEYEGYKLGRALANIAFSGKGLVSKPANPRSVILQTKSVANFDVDDNNSNLLIGDLNMSDINLLEKQLADVQSELSDAKAENAAIKAKIEEAKDKEFASKVEAYEAAADDSKATIEEMQNKIDSTQALMAELQDKLASTEADFASAMKEMDEMKKKEAMMKRKASLVEAGFQEEEIQESIANFDSLNDEAFEAIVAMMKKKAMKMKDEEKEDKDAKAEETEAEESDSEAEVVEASEEEITQEAFEEVESSEASLVEADAQDPMEATRASVSSWLENNLLSNNK